MRSNPASRWIAPLALLAAIAAVFIVISGTTSDSDGDKGNGTPSSQERKGSRSGRTRSTGETTRTPATPKKKTYTVRPGDTLTVISERTGVPVEQLLELNPDIDANSLNPGDKLKLVE